MKWKHLTLDEVISDVANLKMFLEEAIDRVEWIGMHLSDILDKEEESE